MNGPAIPDGQRVYAIGDIHGRLDLLELLMAEIRDDNSRRGPARTSIIVLGDIIDRGPQSAQIVKRLRSYSRASPAFIVLRGNHEEMMVRSLAGDLQALKAWLQFGGHATLKSWGLSDDDLAAPLAEIADKANRSISRDELQWLRTRPFSHHLGDYFFVHAGILPGTALEDQEPEDMLWVKEDFTESLEPHGAVIVHGHTIEEDGPIFRDNRIGLDTGAYRSGRLTALGLDGAERWTLSAALESEIAQTAVRVEA